MLNTSLYRSENLKFDVIKKPLPYLENVGDPREPSFISVLHPRPRVPILKIQSASFHEHSEKRNPFGKPIYTVEYSDQDLKRIRRVELSNEYIRNYEARLAEQGLPNTPSPNRLRQMSAKSHKSLRLKSSSTFRGRNFVSPKPPRTQPSIPQYETRPDLNMSNPVPEPENPKTSRTLRPQNSFADAAVDPQPPTVDYVIADDRGIQTANADIKMVSPVGRSDFAGPVSERLSTTALHKRRNGNIYERLQHKSGKVPEDFTVGNFATNKKLIKRDYKQERQSENDTLDDWIAIDQLKSTSNESRLERRISRKKSAIQETKSKFSKVTTPEEYPKLTRASVMLSASVHLMDQYLKQLKTEK